MSDVTAAPQPSTTDRAFEASRSGEGLALVSTWTDTLDALELHLEEIRAGLLTGVMPTPYEVAIPAIELPRALLGRALKVQAEQRDVEELVRERLATLAQVARGAFGEGIPAPVFLDRRE